jgi:hypothetical protein
MGISIDDSVIICAYNKPSDKDYSMMNKLMRIIPDEYDEPMIIVGDFNMHAALWDNTYGNTTPNPITQRFLDWINEHNMTVLNNPKLPTFFSHNTLTRTMTVLDLAIISPSAPKELQSHIRVNYKELTGSDHVPITWSGTYTDGEDSDQSDLPFQKDPGLQPEWTEYWTNKFSNLAKDISVLRVIGDENDIETLTTFLLESIIETSDAILKRKSKKAPP